MNKRKYSEQELIRRKKAQDLEQKNIPAYGNKFHFSHYVDVIIKESSQKTREQLQDLETTKNKVTIAGRIMTKRGKGKAGFANLKDTKDTIQIYVREDLVGKDDFINIWEPLDLGDFVGVEGYPMKTKVGELSIKVTKLSHLCKALKPLPDKYQGLKDEELIVRKPYLNLVVDEKAKKIALTRPKIIRAIQNFLDKLGFVEVETPVLHSLLGGAAAKPFKTHYNALNSEFYLRVAPELYLKRLLVGGFDKVYEIGRLFRNEGVSKKHNPEFTALELYQSYGDFEDMMNITEDIFHHINKKVFNCQDEFDYDGNSINIAKKFARVNMVEAIKEHTGVDFSEHISLELAKKLAKENGIYVQKHWIGVGHIINAFFEEFVEKKLIQPTFVFGYPVEVSPFAKRNKKDSRFTDRFELFIGAREYANAFSELNDPIDQLERLQQQAKEKDLDNPEAVDIDMDFVEALEHGMPPAGGLGIGIDRMIMFFTGAKTIREVILFPTNKLERDK